MADTIEGLPEGAVVGPSLQKQDQAQVEGLPEGAVVGPSLQTAPVGHGAGGSWDAPQSTASKVWEAANKPMIPEGRAEKEGKEYSTSAPTLSETEHPYWTGAKKGLAGAYADTLETARGLTSPIGVATMGLGGLAEGAGGAVGKIAKIGSRVAGLGFGAQGIKQAVEGGEDIAAHGANPENIKSTLQGAGFGVLGGAGGLHGTEAGEAPAQKTLAAPIRAAAKLAKPASQVIPSVAGMSAASATDMPATEGITWLAGFANLAAARMGAANVFCAGASPASVPWSPPAPPRTPKPAPCNVLLMFSGLAPCAAMSSPPSTACLIPCAPNPSPATLEPILAIFPTAPPAPSANPPRPIVATPIGEVRPLAVSRVSAYAPAKPFLAPVQ